LASLDHLSHGRACWNVVTSTTDFEARNFGIGDLPPKEVRYDRADEVVEACCALWDCWQEDALVMDKESGFFADPEKVRYADYEGRYVRTRGPLTIPRCPQGRPVDGVAVWLRLASVIPKDFKDLLDDARTQTDFFVNLTYLAFLIAIASFMRALYDSNWEQMPNWRALEPDSLRDVVTAVTALTVSVIGYLRAAARAMAEGRPRAPIDRIATDPRWC
jgi:hypothetical protein